MPKKPTEKKIAIRYVLIYGWIQALTVSVLLEGTLRV